MVGSSGLVRLVEAAWRAFAAYRRRPYVPVLLDIAWGGPGRSTVFLTGTPRSGTTWLGEVLNYDNRYREIFEPFTPDKVRLAQPFGFYQYMRPGSDNPVLARAARRILQGQFRSVWTDRANRRLVSTRRLIKDVRAQLMLRWLADLAPGMPIILVLRNPYSVAASWQRLGWTGARDWEAISSQQELLQDYPIVARAMEELDPANPLDVVLFVWCVLAYVPLQQFATGQLYVVFYENVLRDPARELDLLFRWAGRNYRPEEALQAIQRPSKQDIRGDSRDYAAARLAGAALRELPAQFRNKVERLCALFGLDRLYDGKGEPLASSGPITAVREKLGWGSVREASRQVDAHV